MMQAVRKALGSQGDLIMVVAVIFILMLLFVPIPPGLLDFLFITNFSFALLVLLLTFYMVKPLEFSTFPSLLLITTLFRLGLNVSATRLILGEASAGQVIDAVGHYVVGGNYVIGLIVFLVLIVVQYVVVTNGASRVAEVAARFTLDSMPGKQMAIDADLNMGLIDQDQARERRKVIEREANFYGAMDGASRFVKGDAIAGIIIILIDIIGGLAIGLSQRGMSWGEALQTYTLLTIGDGIVTQVPALIVATATGIIVTRAGTDAPLSQEVGRQVAAYPKTIALVAAGLVALMLLPGIPMFPILILLAVAIPIYLAARRISKSREAEVLTDKKPGAESEDLYGLLTIEPIEISIGQNLVPMVGGDNGSFMERIIAFRKQHAMDLGLIFPKIRVKDNKKQGPNHYELRIFGTKVGEGEVIADRWLAINPGGERPAIDGVHAKDPTYGLPAVWIVDDLRKQAREAGYTVVDASTVLLTHMTETIKQHSPNLLTRAETEKLVGRVRERQTSLVEELIPKVVTVGEVQKVMQNLLRERVPIRNVDAILEVLADVGGRSRDPEFLTEQVRERLGATICQSLVNQSGELYVLTLDPTIEQTIAGAIRATDEKATIVLEPKFAEQLLRRIAADVERMMSTDVMPVVLCPPSIRRHLRKLTERVMPQLSVVSLSEVPGHISLKAFGMVSV